MFTPQSCGVAQPFSHCWSVLETQTQTAQKLQPTELSCGVVVGKQISMDQIQTQDSRLETLKT